jgi:hypothetical protein
MKKLMSNLVPALDADPLALIQCERMVCRFRGE